MFSFKEKNMDMTAEKAVEVIMDSNRKSIISQVEKYKNTLVLFTFYVCELLDWHDGEDDYYWIYNDRRNIRGHSCVGGFIPLIDHLPKNIYDRLKREWDMNDMYKWDNGERLARVKANNWVDTTIKVDPEEQELLEKIFNFNREQSIS